MPLSRKLVRLSSWSASWLLCLCLVGVANFGDLLIAGLQTRRPDWAKIWFFSPTQLAAQNQNVKPVPYEDDEFPLFLQNVRRFEVILIGSIPLTILFASLAYDIVYSISNPDIHELTTPSENEHLFGKIGISISISGLLAVLDMAIHLSHRNKARRERERVLRNSEFIKKTDYPEQRTSFETNSGKTKAESPGGSKQSKPSSPAITKP